MYLCIYVSMYLCIYVSMYLCMYVYLISHSLSQGLKTKHNYTKTIEPNTYSNKGVYVHVCIHIYIYIYIERERERYIYYRAPRCRDTR